MLVCNRNLLFQRSIFRCELLVSGSVFAKISTQWTVDVQKSPHVFPTAGGGRDLKMPRTPPYLPFSGTIFERFWCWIPPVCAQHRTIFIIFLWITFGNTEGWWEHWNWIVFIYNAGIDILPVVGKNKKTHVNTFFNFITSKSSLQFSM